MDEYNFAVTYVEDRNLDLKVVQVEAGTLEQALEGFKKHMVEKKRRKVAYIVGINLMGS